MFRTATLSGKLLFIGATLLILALLSIGLTMAVTWRLEGGAAAVNEAGRLRMQAWRLTAIAQAPAERPQLSAAITGFEANLELLRTGDVKRPLAVPPDAALHEELANLAVLWQAQRGLLLDAAAAGQTVPPGSTEQFVAALDHWVSGVERHLGQLTGILNLFQMLMLALAAGSALVVLYTGHLYVISPLAHVREGLRRVEAGDFRARVSVGTIDEFGQLAAGFNRMAQTLQSLYGSLEAQVQAKTRRIDAQHARLAALYEMSSFLSEAGSTEDMAKGFAQRVRLAMHADAAVVRWSDAGARWLLLAADQFPPRLCDAEHSLVTGACACGDLRPDAKVRVIPIHADGPDRARGCTQEGFAAMVSVPIRLHQRLLGELNLFYRSAVALSGDETELVDALATHLANALEGQRLAALEREAAASGERAMLATELHDSIAQSLAFLKLQARMLRSAVDRGQAARVQGVLDELDTGLEESINDVRELLLHFRTRANADDIEPALQATLQKFRHQTGIAGSLQVEGQGLPVPPDVQVQVLHVVQEALSNVRKHASATQVWIRIAKGRRWSFSVRDDGCGFVVDRSRPETHVGLKIMQERAARIGAQLTLESTPGQGTTVVLALPEQMPAAQAAAVTVPAPAPAAVNESLA